MNQGPIFGAGCGLLLGWGYINLKDKIERLEERIEELEN